jgi:hypothetical protein
MGAVARAAALVVALFALPGCLERRIRVVTDPPGAMVTLNDAQIGRSPAETDFTFFGRYDVRVAKEGYETLATTKKAVAPWYEYPFIDLLVIALPFNVETKLTWNFTLRPLEPGPDPAGLLERARTLRSELGLEPVPGSETAPAR